jgi:hypothetical protein
LRPATRRDYDRQMDEFADLNENLVLALTAVFLLMAIFGCAIAVLDHWVWAGRSDLPPERTE